MSKTTISILGLGWFGRPLAHSLVAKNNVMGTTRSPEKMKILTEDGVSVELLNPPAEPIPALLNADVIVFNIPPFKGETDWIKRWNWNQNSHVIFISSTSVYGDLEGDIDEETPTRPTSEGAFELVEMEKFFRLFPHHTIIRFGGLIGPDRHPGNSLSGKKNISGGNHPVNLLHLEDAIDFTRIVIEKNLTQETFNLVHPDHPLRRDYYQIWCRNHQLAIPEFIDTPSKGKVISHKKVSQLYTFRQFL